jgi:hypothetical protein
VRHPGWLPEPRLGASESCPFLFKKIKKLDFYARNIANFFADCVNRFNFVV